MIFGGIQKSCTIDFPGTLACVLFTRGCDLDCFYCHNRGLLASAGPSLPLEEVTAFLEKRRGLLDGVVVSGGEPTLQPDLAAFLQSLRAMGYRTKLDTNGGRPQTVAALWEAGLLDYVALDVKALPGDYEGVCGKAGFAGAAETAETLARLHAAYEVRTTLYPGMTLGDLKDLLGRLKPQPLWRLNYFRRPVEFRPGEEARLAQKALSAPEIQAALPELTALQPNLRP